MKKSFILSILMLLVVSNAFATNGMRMIGFGPVQDSMGGASVGVNLDAASVLTNPAGIQSLGSRVDFGASYFNPTVKTEMMGTEFTSDKKPSPVPALGMVVPLNADLSFGLGAYGISGMGVDYDLGPMMGGLLYTNYTNMRFAPGLAYKLNDMISLGATLNVMYATMEYSMAMDTDNNGVPDMRAANMASSSFGYGASFGITVKPADMVTVGLVYETTSKFQDFEFNQSDSSSVTSTSKNKLKFDQPMNATLGFGFKPVTGLVLAFDVQWIKWSEVAGNDLPEYTGGNFNMQWEDQIVYKFGLQYEVIPMVKVRAGVNYGKMPLSEDTTALQANTFFPAVSEWHYTAGLGIKATDKLTVDLGYMYSPEAKVDSSYGESKMSQYSLDMGIAYNF
ncbi:MAG TPA: outer membrane protein transport protein [Spirochaetota bacterium]|mgnify:CR=1 FL=1|nr:outer membrane protein transport protein [Spirochaetota bacterium]